MPRQSEAQRPVHRYVDTDARRHHTSLTLNPSSRICNGDPESTRSIPLWRSRVRSIAWQSRLGAGGKLACPSRRHQDPRFRAICSAPATGSSAAQQHASSPALRLATEVHAGVAAINCVNISVPCGTKENGVPWRGPSMAVRSRVGWVIVRS